MTLAGGLLSCAGTWADPPPPPPTSYMPVVIPEPFKTVRDRDVAEKPKHQQEQQDLFNARYDLSDNPSPQKMSGQRKAVQQGVRVKLPEGQTWDGLGRMTPDDIRANNLMPHGFRPLPHTKHATGGQVFPQEQIDAIQNLEQRDLKRFDVDFDLPQHLTPEFPPPIFLSNRPDLGDVSKGQVLSLRNFHEMFNGILTPVQLEGLRLLLTPNPQQQFNQTEDRKVELPSMGVSCLDCHTNGHTNAAFHLTPDVRPQANRFRLDSTSLRGMFNQQIHGSKRSLRSIEDFTEFEQRTAYFDGDHVIANKKGAFLPDRANQVAFMAQMQNMFDFPPAPKLNELGTLDPEKATKSELRGQELFMGKAQCSQCHPAPFYLDDKMHDLKLERFYTAETVRGMVTMGEGPIKSFTLRGIKDSPPYLHDGRLLTLEDTVEFFNLVLGTGLGPQEKEDIVMFMRCL